MQLGFLAENPDYCSQAYFAHYFPRENPENQVIFPQFHRKGSLIYLLSVCWVGLGWFGEWGCVLGKGVFFFSFSVVTPWNSFLLFEREVAF